MISDWCDWVLYKIMAPAAVLITTGAVIALVFVVYQVIKESYSPVFTLSKSQWECQETRSFTTTSFAAAGKVIIPVVSTHTECTRYQRKN